MHEILLKHKNIEGIPASFVVDQIVGRRKAKDKLPEFYDTTKIIYPPQLNLEQSSSQQTAAFKAKFLKENLSQSFNNGVDLTGGFGVDSYYVSKLFDRYNYVEPDHEMWKIARHNHHILSANNIAHHLSTAEAFLQTLGKVDFIFIDPSRRSKTNQKVFSFADCVPDILQLQQSIFEKATFVLIKASPLLDIQLGLKELRYTKQVVVLSVDNDCKELLYFCDATFSGEPKITAVNLGLASENSFQFLLSEEQATTPVYAELETFLYEPNASILKAGAFKLLATRLGIKKLHQNTHLYTSTELYSDFPGRIFRIVAITKPDKKALSQYFPEGKANVSTRNYPLTVDELRKKTRLKDGSDKYLIGFTDIKDRKSVV